MNPHYKKLLSNTSLFAIGSFASSLLGMLFVPFYTSVLSTADYGISDLITTTTSLLFPFASLALSEAILRFCLDKNADKKSIYSSGIYTVLCGFLLVLLFSPVIVRSSIGVYTCYFLLYFLCYSIHIITSYFVKGINCVKIYAIGGIIHTLVVITANLIFLLWLKVGIVGYLLALISGHLITTVFLIVASKAYRYLEAPWKIDKSLYRRLLAYSVPIIPNSISWWISNSSDKYVLNYFTSVSEVGIYAVSYKIPTIVTTVMGFFNNAWQLSAVSCFESKDAKAMFGDIYDKCVKLNIIVATGLMIMSKAFGRFLYSNEFFTAWRYVPTLVLANVFNVQATFLGSIYTSAKKTKMMSLTTMIGAVANIVLNFALIPVWGAQGAAVATSVSYMVMWVVRLISARKILPFNFDLQKNIFGFAALTALCILVYMDTAITWCLACAMVVLILVVYHKIILEMLKTVLKGLQSIHNKFKIKKG